MYQVAQAIFDSSGLLEITEDFVADEPKEKAETPKAKESKAEANEAKAPAAESGEKRKKVNCLTLTQVETALKVVKEKMGGFHSGYAQELLLRRKALASHN